LLNGKKGICLLMVNQVCVSKKHHSADVVTICMLLLQWRNALHNLGSWVRIPFTNQCDSSAVRATDNHAGSNPVIANADVAKW